MDFGILGASTTTDLYQAPRRIWLDFWSFAVPDRSSDWNPWWRQKVEMVAEANFSSRL